NARTRTEEHGGNLAGGAARGTQQQQVQGQQVPIAGPAQFCQHAGLLSHWNIYYRRFRHSRTSMIARSVWQPSIYQRVRLCANLLCFDLARGNFVRHSQDRVKDQEMGVGKRERNGYASTSSAAKKLNPLAKSNHMTFVHFLTPGCSRCRSA